MFNMLLAKEVLNLSVIRYFYSIITNDILSILYDELLFDELSGQVHSLFKVQMTFYFLRRSGPTCLNGSGGVYIIVKYIRHKFV